MIRLLTILLLSSVIVSADSLKPKLEIHIVKQKKTPAGRLYGSPGGLYFSYTNLNPFLMYALQYSEDMKTWNDIYNFGSAGNDTTSHLFDWSNLPSDKCFFRVISKW